MSAFNLNLIEKLAQITLGYRNRTLLNTIIIIVFQIYILVRSISKQMKNIQSSKLLNTLFHLVLPKLSLEQLLPKNNFVMYALILFVIFIFAISIYQLLTFKRNHKIICIVFQNCGLFIPILLFMIESYIKKANLINQVIYLFIFQCLSIIWIFRITFLRQSPLHINFKLTSKPQLVCALAIIIGSHLRLFAESIQFAIVIEFACVVVSLYYKIVDFEYVSELLQYIDLVGRLFCLLILMLKTAIFYNPNFNFDHLFILGVVIIALWQRTGILKLVFECKYIKLCKTSSTQSKSTKNLIIITFLLKDLKNKKSINFELYNYLHQLKLNLTGTYYDYERAQFKTQDYFLYQNNYILKMLESKLSTNDDTQYNIFLIYNCLSQHRYFRALAISTTLQHRNLTFNTKYQLQLARKQIFKQFNQYQLLSKPIQSNRSYNLCIRNNIVGPQLNPTYIIEHETTALNLNESVIHLVEENNIFLKKLSQNQIEETMITSNIQNQAYLKRKIEHFVKKHQDKLYFKQFLMIYYIFLDICCSKKYSSLEDLQDWFDSISKSQKSHKYMVDYNKYMIVLVSGEKQSVGQITYASVQMKDFFQIKSESILKRQINIKDFIPKCIAEQHDQFLLNFKTRGNSSFIGKVKQLAMVKKDKAYQVNLLVKVYPYDEGFKYIGRIKLKKYQQMIMIFNQGEFVEYLSPQLSKIIYFNNQINIKELFSKEKPHDSTLKMFPRMSRNNKFNFKKQFTQIIQLKSLGRIKANVSNIRGQQYFMGLCKLTPLGEFTNDYQKFSFGKHATKHQRFMSQIKCQKSEQVEFSKFDKNYPKIQKKIQNMKSDERILIKYILSVVVFLTVSLIALTFVLVETQIYGNTVINEITFYNNAAYGLKSRLFQTNNAFMMIVGSQFGAFSDKILSNFNISSVKTYMNSKILNILRTSQTTQFNIDNLINLMSPSHAQILNQPCVSYSQTIITNISFLYALSLQKNFFVQVFYTNFQVFASQVFSNLGTLQYLKNQFGIAIISLLNTINTLQYNQIQDKGSSYNNYINISYALICASILLVFHFSHQLDEQQLRYITLLNSIDDNDILRKYEINHLGIQVLNEIKKFSIKQLFINDKEYFTIVCFINQMEYNFKQGEIYFHNQKAKRHAIQKIISKTKKKVIIEKKYITRIWRILLVLMMFLASIIYMWIAQQNAGVTLRNQMSAYYSYSSEISALRLAVPELLNIVTMKSGLPTYPTHYLGQNAEPLFYNLLQSISSRNIQTKLRQLVSWNVIEPFLYSSNCSLNDSLCKILLNGALQQGFSASLVQFTEEISLMYQMIKNGVPFSITSKIQCELNLVYFQYLRPLLKTLHDLSLNSSITLANSLIENIQQLYFAVLSSTFLLCFIWFIYDVAIKRNSMRYIKKQILSFATVDVLTHKINFAYEFTLI